MIDITASAEAIVASVKGFVSVQVEALRREFASLSERVDLIAKTPGPQGEKGMDGRDGREGEPGRDAAQIDVLPFIHPARKYQRGTFATHAGGLLRSFRTTDPLCENLDACGWQVVVNGLTSLEIEQISERWFRIYTNTTVGKSFADFHMPVVLEKGVFRETVAYEKGDGVSFGGSFWIAQKDDPQGKPGTSPDWRLAVKRGRDAA